MRKRQKICRVFSEATCGVAQINDGTAEDINKSSKRERNRAAAYKNRTKFMMRADNLHQEFQRLEKDNTALEKEIESLKLQKESWEQVLKEHENICLLLSPEIISDFLQSLDPMWSADAQALNVN